MQLIRAVFHKQGRISKRGYLTHYNDGGLPLCRVMNRKGHVSTASERCEWVTEFGVTATCKVCKRMEERRRTKKGSAA